MKSLKVRVFAVGCGIWLTSLGLVAAEQMVGIDAESLIRVSPKEVKGILWDVWASPDGDFVAVGEGGLIVFRDDTGWTERSRGLAISLRGVWGAASDDVFVVGLSGAILHFDGSTWQVVHKDGPTLYSVWGDSGSNVFVVGSGGVILHYDGAAWSPMASGVGVDLVAVHGTSSSNVFAVGTAGTVIRYDGAEWSRIDGGLPPADFTTVWVASADDAFVAGGGGFIGRFNGRGWSSMLSGTADQILDLVGVSAEEVYAVTMHHEVLRFDDGRWSLLGRTKARFWPWSLAISASGEGVIVGFVGEFVYPARDLPPVVTSGTGGIVHFNSEVPR
ncbi:MAG: hypothetical protein K8R59_12905 [Thermoanaerobaculales bacterium]|nr:hypothetical protein [Thermoanaerobaculales bacterium]